MHLIFEPVNPDNRLSSKTIIGNRKKLTQWQDAFHTHMVKKYPNFERDESASSTGRVHLPPRQHKAAIHLTEPRSAIIDKIRSVNVFNMKTLLPEIMMELDKYIRGAESFKTQLVNVARKTRIWKRRLLLRKNSWNPERRVSCRNCRKTAAVGTEGEGATAPEHPAGDH